MENRNCGCENIASCAHRGEPSGHFEYTRVVPGDIRGFDVQVATHDCKRWHHVFSTDKESDAKAIERYIRYAGVNVWQRQSHRKACLVQPVSEVGSFH